MGVEERRSAPRTTRDIRSRHRRPRRRDDRKRVRLCGREWRRHLARKDAPASYHLACVVDDAASGVTLVVRGVDLRPSTPIQRLLQKLLGLPEPAYHHHPLVTQRWRPSRQARPRADARRDARGGRRRPGLAPACSRPASRLVSPSARLKDAHAHSPPHPPPARHGGDSLRAGPRCHGDGVGQGCHRRAVSSTGCASACCSRRSRS